MGRQGQSRYPAAVNAPRRRNPVSRVKKYSQRGADFSWESVDTFMCPGLPADSFPMRGSERASSMMEAAEKK